MTQLGGLHPMCPAGHPPLFISVQTAVTLLTNSPKTCPLMAAMLGSAVIDSGK